MESRKEPNRENESDDRNLRKEAALARRLAEAFDKIGTSAGGDCLAPEQIAAYHEGALSPEESATCESHFASCARCRKILTILAAGAETPLADTEVARMGELAAASSNAGPAAVASDSSGSSDLPGDPRLEPVRAISRRPCWLVPVFAAAAVLLLALITRPIWHPEANRASQNEIAQAPAAPAPNAVAPDSSAATSAPPPAAISGTPPAEPNLPPVNPAAPEAVPKQPPATKEQAKVDDLVSQASDYSATNRLDKTESAAKAAAAAAGQSAAVRTPAPQAQAAPQAPAPSAASNRAVVENRSITESPINSRNAPANAPLNAPLSALAGTPATGGFAVVLRSPSAPVSWRAGAGGRIERSSDGGRTWQAQQSPSRDDWLAGSAVSATICWLAGRNSSVARTTDGQTWEPIAGPSIGDNAANRPDWVAVAATDADNATLTSRDRQRYATHDGGRTWEKQ